MSIRSPKTRAALVTRRLRKAYPTAGVTLNHRTPFQLVVAVILSAQCTDKKVNEVMRPHFRRYKTAADFTTLTIPQLEKMVHQTGFYKSKARAIYETAKIVQRDFGGKVPKTMEEMLTLRGVARKSSNVILGALYGVVEGVIVDTHVTRLANRLRLTKSQDAVVIERNLMKLLPRKDWNLFGHLLVAHGRAICMARTPNCAGCVLNDICPSAFTFSS